MPNEGACDWGLNQALRKYDPPEVPTCQTCKVYYDGRPNTTNFFEQDCVWVPSEDGSGMCYPKNHAESKGWDYNESCEGFNFYLSDIVCEFIIM